MPQTLEALIIVAIALVPGAAYRLSFEGIVGPWGTTLSDRVVHFLVYSAIFHAVLPLPLYILWHTLILNGNPVEPQIPKSPWIAFVSMAYVLLPSLFGLLHGALAKNNKSVLPDPHPTAREYLFGYERRGWVRIRLTDETWVAGFYGLSSTTGLKGYASSYGESDADILLSEVVNVDTTSGQWKVEADGTLSVTASALLVPWRQISQLEFEPA